MYLSLQGIPIESARRLRPVKNRGINMCILRYTLYTVFTRYTARVHENRFKTFRVILLKEKQTTDGHGRFT